MSSGNLALSMRAQLSSNWGDSLRNAEHFPDPFMDMGSLAMPENLRTALYYEEFIFMANGTYRAAMERAISYFLTDVELDGEHVDNATKDQYTEFLTRTLDILGLIQRLDRDFICYGNGFASLIVPFRRYLICPSCHGQFPLHVVYNQQGPGCWDHQKLEFVGKCPACDSRVQFGINDQPEDEEKNVKVKLWSPHEMEILHDPWTHDCAYLWKIPEDYKRQVRQGSLYHLERVPQEILKAIRNNWLFRFAPDAIYHMKEPTLGGIINRGWGISRTITNFRQIWYCQVLHRFNEAIALDYVIPFRVITPVSTGGAGGRADPLLSTNMGDFMGNVRNMLRKRRRDPATWHTLPFPVQYQALGGDATQLAPRDILDQGLDQLLNMCHTPVEMYKGTMQLQTALPAMRLYEAVWHPLVHANNGFLVWLMRQTANLLGWEPLTARLKRVTHADDMNRQMAQLQLMTSQLISKTTGLRALDIDYRSEVKQQTEEAVFEAEQQARAQEEMQQAGFAADVAKGMLPGQQAQGGQGGGGGGGDQPPPPDPVGQALGGGQQSMTPQDMLQHADSLAQQLLGMPESAKDSQLRQLKQKNETLHALVRQKMDGYRRQAQTQGGAAVLASQFGQNQGQGQPGGGS